MEVSIAVVSYNSSKTVVETLNSIVLQNYCLDKLELIISDDGSSDNTKEVVNEWLFINAKLFSKVQFVESLINKGVSSNCNIAWKKCSHDWIKTIAADDILEPNCIRENVNYIKNNKNCRIVFSRMRWFGSVNKVTPSPYDVRFFSKDSEYQYESLKRFSFNIAPSSFINRETLKELGYANEDYKTIEDLPLWLSFTRSGYKLYFLNVITVNYRVSESISMSDTKFINTRFLEDLISINEDYALPFFKSPITEIIRREQLLWYRLNIKISKVFNNKKNTIVIFIARLTWFFRPIHLIKNIWFNIYNNIVFKFI